MIRRKGKKQQRRGAAVVETAVMMPLVLTMLFGIIEFGWVFSVQQTLVNAAREGARTGVLTGRDATDMRQRVLDYLDPLHVNTANLSIDCQEATQVDPTVRVRLSVPREDVSLVGDFFGFFGGTLNAECSMRREGL